MLNHGVTPGGYSLQATPVSWPLSVLAGRSNVLSLGKDKGTRCKQDSVGRAVSLVLSIGCGAYYRSLYGPRVRSSKVVKLSKVRSAKC